MKNYRTAKAIEHEIDSKHFLLVTIQSLDSLKNQRRISCCLYALSELSEWSHTLSESSYSGKNSSLTSTIAPTRLITEAIEERFIEIEMLFLKKQSISFNMATMAL